MSKLKFCPFCGGEAEVIVKKRSEVEVGYFGNDEVACVSCIRCRCRTNWFLHMPLAEVRVISVWNTRHEPPTHGGAIVPAGNKRMKKPLKKCLQCNTVIEYNDIRLDDMGYSCCPHCQSNRLKTIYEVIDG